MLDKEKIVIGGGCFWCLEAIYTELKGIDQVEVGYAGGTTANPSYEEVCSGKNKHVEVVKIVFNPKIISLQELLEIFFTIHDPTSKDRQGANVGIQYRSVIFYNSLKQKQVAEKMIKELTAKKIYDKDIVTEVLPLNNYYEAESYHQYYYHINREQAYCRLVINPKLRKFRKLFASKLINKE